MNLRTPNDSRTPNHHQFFIPHKHTHESEITFHYSGNLNLYKKNWVLAKKQKGDLGQNRKIQEQ